MDVSDSRFAALFTSPEFALDPTDPRFAASEGTQKILRETARRRNTKGGKSSTAAAVKAQAGGHKASARNCWLGHSCSPRLLAFESLVLCRACQWR